MENYFITNADTGAVLGAAHTGCLGRTIAYYAERGHRTTVTPEHRWTLPHTLPALRYCAQCGRPVARIWDADYETACMDVEMGLEDLTTLFDTGRADAPLPLRIEYRHVGAMRKAARLIAEATDVIDHSRKRQA